MVELLIKTLEETYEAHKQLMELTTQKRTVLIEGNVEQLSQIVHQESQLIKHIGKLEEERLFQVKELLQRKGVSTDQPMTMQQIIQTLSTSEEKKQLEALFKDLSDLLGKMSEQNSLNMRLTQDSLNYVNQSLELYTETAKTNVNYEKPKQAGGKTKQQPRQGFFDTKA